MRSIPGHGRLTTSKSALIGAAPDWPSRVTISAAIPGSGRVAEPGLAAIAPGHRRDHYPAGFGLPPGIDDRTALAADHFVVPDPGFGIDRFADRSEQSQAREVVLLDPRLAPLDKSADRGRRGIEDIDAVLFDYRPEAIFLRKVRRALVHHDRRARRERPVHRVAMAGDPSDIRGTPVDILFLEIEYPLHRRSDVGQIAAGRMDDAFGLTGRA